MSTVYLVIDDNSASPIELCPSLRKARQACQMLSKDGESAPRIEALPIKMTQEGVCQFISHHFGVAIFEN